MRTLYLDLSMGAAGDMLTAALLELLPDPDSFIEKLNSVNIPGVKYIMEKTVKNGISGTNIHVLVNGAEEGEHTHEHKHEHEQGHSHAHGHEHHGDMEGITHIVNDHLSVSENIKEQIIEVYSILADAESRVHGVPVSDIHFHEVGTMDAVADITAFCMLINEISPDRILASPVHAGSGEIRCAHGILPVPAPATAEILRGIPFYAGEIKGELCTPTGAALIKRFVNSFGDMPVITVERIGYGMGKKALTSLNCVRAFIGESRETPQEMLEISFNVDDMTAEETGFAVEALFENGANDVFTVPAGMKKDRPGTLICFVCEKSKRDQLLKTVFKHTSTIGVREKSVLRHVMNREIQTLNTKLGPVRLKTSRGFGEEKSKPEYDDISRIAKENAMSLREVKNLIEEELYDE